MLSVSLIQKSITIAVGLHHEQVEMVENCFGQYEHNNQPVWHMLWVAAPAYG